MFVIEMNASPAFWDRKEKAFFFFNNVKNPPSFYVTACLLFPTAVGLASDSLTKLLPLKGGWSHLCNIQIFQNKSGNISINVIYSS